MTIDRTARPFDVVHVIDSLGRSGGAEQQLVGNLRRFDDERLHHRILCLDQSQGDTRRPEVPDEVEVEYLFPRRQRSRNRLTLSARVYMHLRRRTPDLIHCSLPDAALAARIAGRLCGVPVVESLVNISHEPVRTIDNPAVTRPKLAAHRLVDRLTMRWVARFQALSEEVRDSWVAQVNLPGERIVVIPRGVDLTQFGSGADQPGLRSQLLAELGLDQDAFVILNIGRQVAQKGQIYAIRAMPGIRDSIPSAVFLSVGSAGASTRALQEEVGRLELGEVVRWLGVREDIPRLLATADVFVFPSLYEGLGVSLLEAMGAGIPCVTTNRPPMTGVVSHEVNGLLVPSQDQSAIARAVIRLAEDAGLRGTLAERGRADVMARYDSKQIAKRVEELYLETLDGVS